MARYSIDSLNYMAVGQNRVFINMDVSHYDVSSHTYVLETENQPAMLSGPASPAATDGIDVNSRAWVQTELSDGTGSYLQALLSTSTSQYLDAVEDFNLHRKTPNRTFVLDDLPARLNGGSDTTRATGHVKNMYRIPSPSDRDRWIFPMYQLEDVCVKQNSQHRLRNPTILSGDRNFDVYSAALDSDPVGFCQAGNGSFVLTKETTSSPYQAGTNLVEDRTKAYDTVYYEYSVSAGHVPTYLYRTADEQKAVLASSASPDQVFEPAVDMTGIGYNYVIEMDHAADTPYDNGDVFGQINTTKNMYGPVYSMDMTGRTSISACREYVGIDAGRGALSKQQPYLKFMDDLSYSGSPAGGISASMTPSRRGYTYQKIEYVYPTRFTGNAKHKSTLFSVSVNGSGILSAENEYRYRAESASGAEERKRNFARLDAIERLKRDIKSAVREIAQNVAPANTQLFDTYFEED